MVVLVKDGAKKTLDDTSGLIPILKADGWKVEGQDVYVETVAEEIPAPKRGRRK